MALSSNRSSDRGTDEPAHHRSRTNSCGGRTTRTGTGSTCGVGFVGITGPGAIVTFAHTFPPASAFNRMVSTLPLFAHTFAFPLQFGVGSLALSTITAITLLIRQRIKKAPKLPGGAVPVLTALSGLVLVLSSTYIALPILNDQQLRNASLNVVTVSWNAHDLFDKHSADTIFNSLDADIAALPELNLPP